MLKQSWQVMMPKIPPRFKVIDSGRDLELPEHRMFSVVYEPVWQKLRASGSFKSVDDAHRTIANINRYLIGKPEDKQYRVWRAYSYMNSVPIGQPAPSGLLRVPKDAEDIIIGFRTQMATLIKEVGRPVMWDWNFTRGTLASLVSKPVEIDWLKKHFRNLTAARANKARKQAKIELHYYLDLVMEAIDG
jgi:hypothetical protein